ncbi:polysaccharide deacetylase family protein [Pediococcus stilesii]|uniref:Intercellular adhesion protein n=1 Tax=Pediococcus stilesii TaxID=331679 RepID=A0A0R2L1V5_9LACO|nr:polysaccharide deacetylase family protein [Pediococcus stilesii]KRN93130.1 intercellular adhesion protein [Pediococcus stilesii]
MHSLKRFLIAIGFTIFLVFLGISIGKDDLHSKPANNPKFAIAAVETNKKNGLAILNYHRVLNDSLTLRTVKKVTNNNQLHDYNITTQEFKNQILELKKANIKFITLAEAENLARNPEKIKGKYVAITFDDMADSAYKNAYPVLKKYKIPFSSFIITSRTDKYVVDSKMASWDHLREMQNSGLLTIGLHTHDMHYLINDVAVGKIARFNLDFKKDYAVSQNKLQKHLGIKANYFAAPYGNIHPQNAKFLNSTPEVTAYFNLSQEIIGNSDHQDFEVSRILINRRNWKQIQTWISN